MLSREAAGIPFGGLGPHPRPESPFALGRVGQGQGRLGYFSDYYLQPESCVVMMAMLGLDIRGLLDRNSESFWERL